MGVHGVVVVEMALGLVSVSLRRGHLSSVAEFVQNAQPCL